MKDKTENLIFSYSKNEPVNSYAESIREIDSPPINNKYARGNFDIGEYSEADITRHFTHLAAFNFGVDTGFYPLGSCTMKYNPKINEKIANMPGFTNLHPYSRDENMQGTLELLYNLNQALCELTGFAEFALNPAAGAHGELTGMLIIKKYFEVNNQPERNIVLIPSSAHGTNPASAQMAGFTPITIKANEQGMVNLDDLKKHLTKNVAAMMITNPNTVGIYEIDLPEISELLHSNGSLLYMDGANFNAVAGWVKPVDMGADVMHFNMHKTFSTPHGGGGPGAGPVGVVQKLRDMLPVPFVVKKDGTFNISMSRPNSIGFVHTFLGNVSVLIRAYAYIRALGLNGLKKAAESAVLNANYMMNKLSAEFDIPHKNYAMHEFVIDGSNFKKYGVTTLDVAKRIIDYGFHPPTIYFPHIVHDALMIEPTETESKQTLDSFVEALKSIKKEMLQNPDLLHNAPSTTLISRPDEVSAARDILKNVRK